MTVTIHGGAAKPGTIQLIKGWEGHVLLPLQLRDGTRREYLVATDVRSVEPITQESVKNLAGTLGGGVIGGLVLGPVGAAAGLLAGGQSSKISFELVTFDGVKLYATGSGSGSDFTTLRAGAANLEADPGGCEQARAAFWNQRERRRKSRRWKPVAILAVGAFIAWMVLSFDG